MWIKAEDKVPEGKVLVLAWNPFFGKLVPEVMIGYYDNPKDYTNNAGKGWCEWTRSNPIIVSHWMPLPAEPDDLPKSFEQVGFQMPELGTLKLKGT